MKIWILGGRGLLGSTLAKACLRQNLPFVSTGKEVDIRKEKSLQKFLDTKEAEGVTHVVNCAALADVDRCHLEPELAFEVNSLGPAILGKEARKKGLHVLHISSDYVFGGQGSKPYQETDPGHPFGVYAETKWAGEQALLQELDQACVLRTSWLFGKGGKNFISSLLKKIQTDEEIPVAFDQLGRPTFAADLADVILKLLPYSGIFHFANRGAISRFQMAEKILSLAKELSMPIVCRRLIPVKAAFFPSAAPRPSYCVLSTEKIEKTLHITPRSWEDVLEEYITDAI